MGGQIALQSVLQRVPRSMCKDHRCGLRCASHQAGECKALIEPALHSWRASTAKCQGQVRAARKRGLTSAASVPRQLQLAFLGASAFPAAYRWVAYRYHRD